MKKQTIHLSLPRGSTPPELHAQVSAETALYLSMRASRADTSVTAIASLILAASAAAAKTEEGADLTVDFAFPLPGARDLTGARNEVRGLTQVIASFRLALASRSAGTDAEREARAARLAAGEKALAAVAATLAKLEALCGLASGQLVAGVVRRALAEPTQTEPAAAAPTAPAPVQALPPGVTPEDLEAFLLKNSPRAAEASPVWVACALAAHGLGQEFKVPRPKSKPTPPPTPPPPAIPPSPAPPAPVAGISQISSATEVAPIAGSGAAPMPAAAAVVPPPSADGPGAVDKLVTAAANAKPEGQP